MLEMGEPVKIYELAERMIRLSGYAVGSEIPVEITGIRPGEKLNEELSAPDEECDRTDHESIIRLQTVLMPSNLLRASLAHFAYCVSKQDDDASRAVVALANGDTTAVPADLCIDPTPQTQERSHQWNLSSI
jgi:O-antigen biosynthesis protein WbqV